MKGKARRLLSWVCVLALCMSLLPVTALAVEQNVPTEGNSESYVQNGDPVKQDGVIVSKIAERTEQNAYNITLSVTVPDNIVVPGTDTDVVLVVDSSGSMSGTKMWSAKQAAKDFTEQLVSTKGATVRVGIVDYDTTAQVVRQLSDDTEGLDKDLGKIEASGGTNIQAGLHEARTMLNNSSSAKKVIVLLSDGDPTFSYPVRGTSGWSGCDEGRFGSHDWNEGRYGDGKLTNIQLPNKNSVKETDFDYSGRTGDGNRYEGVEALLDVTCEHQKTKTEHYSGAQRTFTNNGDPAIAEAGFARTAGCEIYSLYLGNPSTNATHTMKGIATNDAHYKQADESSLSDLLKQIAGDVTSTTAGAVTDPMGDNIVLGDVSGLAGVKKTEDDLTWDPTQSQETTNEDGSTTYTVTYPITVNTDDPDFEEGWYPANKITTFTYRVNGEKHTINFNVPNVWGENPVRTNEVYIQVFLDDTNVTQNWQSYLSNLTTTGTTEGMGDPEYKDNHIVVPYAYEDIDAADVQFGIASGYVLQGVQGTFVYGQRGWNEVSENGGTWTVDNVDGNTTLSVYLNTAYSVEYKGYGAEGITDSNIYINQESVNKSQAPDFAGINDSSSLEARNQGKNGSWKNPAENIKTEIAVAALPAHAEGWTNETNDTTEGGITLTVQDALNADLNKGDSVFTFTATAATYTVTYTDGVDGEEIFADQVTRDLTYGADTPVFDGTPTRPGYTFAGWEPEVSDTVTGNATYTAQWTQDKYTVTYTDGVDGEEIFADQVTRDLTYGVDTPVFDGTPTRPGYTFAGWEPEVSDTVTGNATYTAKWEAVSITKDLTSVIRDGQPLADFNVETYTAQVGDQLTYTITVKNTGNTHIKVVVTDSLWGNGVDAVIVGGNETFVNSDGITLFAIEPNSERTITYTYTVQPDDISKNTIVNTANAYIGEKDDNPEGTDEETVTMDDYTVTITPADITIYTGGDGYGGVTNESGAIIDGTEASGLPEPGYHIELPAAVVNWLAEQGVIASGSDADTVAANLSEYLTFTYDYNNQTRNWSMDYAGIYATNEDTGEPTRYVYTLNPATVDGKEIPVRLLYKNGEEVVSTDDILMSETLVSDQFSMTINPGELTQSQIRAKLTVEGQSISCNIDIQPGTLTVRSTTDKDTTTGIVDSQENVTGNTITAVDGGEVQYYVNNSEVTVDADRVQLLVDEVSNGEEFNAAMGADAIERVTNAAGNTLSNAAYDLAYMDLVDTQNGNTVVTMGDNQSLFIYWPVPEDAAEDSEFHVVHYTGMDREGTVDIDKLEEQQADVKTGAGAVEKVTIGDQEYVKFTTSSFSPFALVYEKAPDPVAKLEVTKTLTKVNGQPYTGGSVSVNDTLTYTITVKNGEVALKDVTITDTFTGKGDLVFNGYTATENPDGTYTIELGNLEANETVTITATYKVLRADASSNLVNTAKVTGTNPVEPDTPVTDEVQTPETPVNPYRPPIRPPEHPDKPELNTEDHYAYIVGYEDGSVQPEGDITRAEVATIFFRLLTDESRNEYWSQTNPYSDVSADDWFNNAVSTLTNAGVLDGYEDGTFKPNGNITRAEFATITARFFEATYDGENLFPDIEGHWAQDYINEAANAGIVNGYEDGTFRPQQYITRAEAVTMVNRTIERHPDADHLLDDMIVWPDNPETAWYYEQIQEATNSHEYTMNTDDEQNPYEIWTKLLPNRDWSELEKEWSDANDGAGSGEVV